MANQTPTIDGDSGPREAVPVILVTPDGETYANPNLAANELDVFAAVSRTGVSASGHLVLVDASDTINFPHTTAGGIVASGVYISVDRDTNAVGSVFIGVITAINATSATVKYLQGMNFEKSDSRSLFRDRRYSPSELSFVVAGGNLVGSITNATTTGITAINTETALDSPRGTATVTPEVGDIVVTFNRSAGTYDFTASMHYHGVAP